MYRPQGAYPDIGDVEIIEHEGLLHMFHLVIPNRDLVAHAVSEDGLSWRRVRPALRTGNPGAIDDDMIRTVSVTRQGDRFVMLYCATSERDGGRVERAVRAVSADLYTWEKESAAALRQPDPGIYESRADGAQRDISWRDPKPFYENGTYYCAVCARLRSGPELLRGCAALAISTDLQHWTYEEPLLTTGLHYALECPQLYRIGDAYYLIASIMEDRSQRYWIADRATGPFRAPPGGTLLFPPGTHYAARLGRYRGEDVLACWTFAREDGPSPMGLRVHPGAEIKYVPALLCVHQEPDLRLSLRSVGSWEGYASGAPEPIAAMEGIGGTGILRGSDGHFELNSPHGGAMALARGSFRHVTVRARLRTAGERAGIVLHAQPDGGGYRLEFLPQEKKLQLVCHAARTREDGAPWFSYRVLASRSTDAFEDARVMLRAVNGEWELSVNGRVLFATVSTALPEGRIGIFAEMGACEVRDFTVQSMRAPGNLYEPIEEY